MSSFSAPSASARRLCRKRSDLSRAVTATTRASFVPTMLRTLRQSRFDNSRDAEMTGLTA